jgi:hypothetical protein
MRTCGTEAFILEDPCGLRGGYGRRSRFQEILKKEWEKLVTYLLDIKAHRVSLACRLRLCLHKVICCFKAVPQADPK